MNVLVVGATGTLGRQVARKAIEAGHAVTCLVRNPTKAAFLSEWGAKLKVGSLTQPDTLAPALEGMEVAIDCATVRPSSSLSLKEVDWDGKVALINAARAAEIKQYMFFSVLRAEEFPTVPLMNFKHHIENYLKQSLVPYTIFRPCGFMQGLIGQYAIPILEDQLVWTTKPPTAISYIDTLDAAAIAVKAIGCEGALRQTLPLAGSKAWTPSEVIALCEKLSNKTAKIATMPIGILRGARNIANFFQWTWNIGDRLAFAEVLASGKPMHAEMQGVYELLDIDPEELTTLEGYLLEYFERILKKLRDTNYKDPKKMTRF
ncbi:NmrA family NAD(P)-binding protein [Synechococcus sp. PCC 7336]|uniref:NmrA family NAD(P)-binding protein n=1 Tax=Synechococcus sp. PCC 7336 TaxID=195250 RepID=UPI00034A3FEC|nr:NmrA family NAD(P)-binding protein [Synechococcus sp. PCC 7336]